MNASKTHGGKRCSLLYAVDGETSGGDEEQAHIVAANEVEASQFARNTLGYEVITAVHLVHDCLWV